MKRVPTGGDLQPLFLRRVVARLDATAAEQVRDHGLTIDQWRMLELLVARGPLPMAALSEELSLPGATATRVADRLVNDALIYRDIDSTDRRRVVLHAANRGRRLHDQLVPDVERAQERVLVLLAEDDQEQFPLIRRALSPSTSESSELT